VGGLGRQETSSRSEVLGRGQTGLFVGETLKVDREYDSDGFAVKAMSGGDVKAPPRRRE
jgi:hypothetical protein